MDDPLDDHVDDGSGSLGASDGGERFERRSLLWEPAFGAKAHKTVAERCEGFHGAARSPSAGFGRERTGVGQPSVGKGGDQRSVRQALRGEALNRCPIGISVDRRSVAEQVEFEQDPSCSQTVALERALQLISRSFRQISAGFYVIPAMREVAQPGGASRA